MGWANIIRIEYISLLGLRGFWPSWRHGPARLDKLLVGLVDLVIWALPHTPNHLTPSRWPTCNMGCRHVIWGVDWYLFYFPLALLSCGTVVGPSDKSISLSKSSRLGFLSMIELYVGLWLATPVCLTMRDDIVFSCRPSLDLLIFRGTRSVWWGWISHLVALLSCIYVAWLRLNRCALFLEHKFKGTICHVSNPVWCCLVFSREVSSSL